MTEKNRRPDASSRRSRDFYIFLFLVSAATFLSLNYSIPATAEKNYYNSSEKSSQEESEQDTSSSQKEETRTITVTSVQKCYAQLGREEAMDIRKNYIKPYQECQRRLSLLQKEKQPLKSGKTKDAVSKTREKDKNPEKTSPVQK